MNTDREIPLGRQNGRTLLTDCGSISSGTLAGLIGDSRYSVIEAVERVFFRQVKAWLKQGVCDGTETWQQAWNLFAANHNFQQDIADA